MCAFHRFEKSCFVLITLLLPKDGQGRGKFIPIYSYKSPTLIINKCFLCDQYVEGIQLPV